MSRRKHRRHNKAKPQNIIFESLKLITFTTAVVSSVSLYLTDFLAPASQDLPANKNNHLKKETLDEVILNPTSFAVKRISNFKESVTDALSQSFVDLFAGELKFHFGDNPTSASIFRDISRIPAIFANAYNKNRVGGTDIEYDEGAIYSSLVKISCKTSILSTTYLFSSKKQFEYIARTSNFVCEVPNRFLNIVTKERQREEKANLNDSSYMKKEFWDYTFTKSKISWLIEAIPQTIIKIAIADQLGEAIKNIGYKNVISSFNAYLDNQIAVATNIGTIFSPNDDIYYKFSVCTASITNNWFSTLKYSHTFSSILLVDWSLTFLSDITDNYVLGTPIKILQDFTGIVTRAFNDATNDVIISNYLIGDIAKHFMGGFNINGSAEL